jgi:uncharacterized membrane protein YhaH (DUF805 family)
MRRRSEDNSDRLGVAAIVVGCIGIVVLGLVLAIVTATLAAEAGRRARDAGRSMENAYIGFALAIVDAVVWLVLHLAFDLAFIAG